MACGVISGRWLYVIKSNVLVTVKPKRQGGRPAMEPGIIYLTTDREMTKKSGQAGGSHEAYGARGVWVPEGMTAAEIMEGAKVLTELYQVEHYEARSMVREVLTAIKNLPKRTA